MSVRTDVAADLQRRSNELVEAADEWPARQVLEPARAAVEEAAAILNDAVVQLTAPPALRAR